MGPNRRQIFPTLFANTLDNPTPEPQHPGDIPQAPETQPPPGDRALLNALHELELEKARLDGRRSPLRRHPPSEARNSQAH
ncbi:hypothetical protein V8E54_009314 [Elaphomyces granulatus]